MSVRTRYLHEGGQRSGPSVPMFPRLGEHRGGGRMDQGNGQGSEFEAIVVGGGTAGAVCAATLALRGVHTLLIAETAQLGHNLRSVEVDGHRGATQHPWWHIA